MLAVCAAGAALACNKGPARAALAETDQALAAARPELARDAPQDLARIVADTETVRRLVEAGEYTNALRIAQTLPERIARASERARARKGELTPAWTSLAASLPASIEALRTRSAELDAARGPGGRDPAASEAAEGEIEEVVEAWAQAESAFDAGDVREAVRIGTDAQAKAAALAARIARPSSARVPVRVPAASSVPARPAEPASGASPESPPSRAPTADDSATPAGGESAPPQEPPPTTPPDTTVPSGRESGRTAA